MEEITKNIITGIALATGVVVTAVTVKSMLSGSNNQDSRIGNTVTAGVNSSLSSTPSKSSRNSSSIDDLGAVRVLKKQEGQLWCGYSVVEGLMKLAGKDVGQQGFLADSLLEITGDVNCAVEGNLTANEIDELFNKRDLKVYDLSVVGKYLEKELGETLNQYGFVIIGKGGHWQIAQLDNSATNGKNLLIHDPLFATCKNGMMVPKRYSLSEFCAGQDKSYWNIIALSEKNEKICKDSENNIIEHVVNDEEVENIPVAPKPTQDQMKPGEVIKD